MYHRKEEKFHDSVRCGWKINKPDVGARFDHFPLPLLALWPQLQSLDFWGRGARTNMREKKCDPDKLADAFYFLDLSFNLYGRRPFALLRFFLEVAAFHVLETQLPNTAALIAVQNKRVCVGAGRALFDRSEEQ